MGGVQLKSLDLNKSLYDLTEEYPELITILRDNGFEFEGPSPSQK